MNIESNIPPLFSTDTRVKVGIFTYGNPRFKLWQRSERIEIGAFCSIADDVTIFGGGEHKSDWVTTFPLRIALGDSLAEKDGHPSSKGPTKIGSDVWIGFGATILSGVIVGDGAIIGAKSVVARSVPPFAIVVGNPAKLVRYRFLPEQIAALVKIKWWDWPIDKIVKFLPDLCSPDIETFIQKARQC